jgi:hypothetical protein
MEGAAQFCAVRPIDDEVFWPRVPAASRPIRPVSFGRLREPVNEVFMPTCAGRERDCRFKISFPCRGLDCS